MTNKQDGCDRVATYGEHVVGVDLNSSEGASVDEIKRMAAKIIDYICENGKHPHYTRLAINEIEAAAIWGVRSVTK